jgi:serine/threonine protein kinase
MSDVATFTTITIYSLSGLINVVLFLSTRSDRLTGNKRNGLEMAPGTALVVKKSKPLSTNDVECGSLRLESYTSEPAPPDELILKSSEPVSHGAFSDIWRGSLDNCLVAVKYIRVARSDEQKLQARLSIYVEAIQQLEHPNVLPVIGLSRDPDRGLGMVSPWMEHGNVIKYLKTSPNANRLQLISDLTNGLAYLHNKNIVHGDLSPANFLIDANGSPCLSSFGRSSIVESLFEAPFDRAPSYRYMAPELLLVGSQVTPASDIYSFAMCCYEILSGHSPFNNIPSEVDVIFAIYNREHPSRPPIFDPATSRGLDDRMWALMMECWNANPDNRPTANALCYSLPTMHAMACSPTTDVNDKESEGRHMSRL